MNICCCEILKCKHFSRIIDKHREYCICENKEIIKNIKHASYKKNTYYIIINNTTFDEQLWKNYKKANPGDVVNPVVNINNCPNYYKNTILVKFLR